MSYTPLRIQSAYSFRESLIRLPELMAEARALGLRSLVLTDRDHLFGAVPFAQLAARFGVRPLLGASLTLADGTCLTLLIQNAVGQANLHRLIARRHLQGPPGWDVVAAHTEGLLAMCGGEEGAVHAALERNDFMGALGAARRLSAMFGDRAYLEAPRPAPKLAAVAAAARMAVAATHPVRYLRPNDAELYLIAQRGYERDIPDIPDHHLASPAEWEYRWRTWPEALVTTEAIARRCHYTPELDAHAPAHPAWLASIRHLDARAAVRLAGAGLGLPDSVVEPIALASRSRSLTQEWAQSAAFKAMHWDREPFTTLLAAASAFEGMPDHVAAYPGSALMDRTVRRRRG